MQTIGLIGGMSWESTTIYYQHLNRLARKRLGVLHSAKVLLWSVDFAEIEQQQTAQNWESLTQSMVHAAQKLQNIGAECLIICSNTMHKMAAEVEEAINIPFIHIADATAIAIKKSQTNKPLLLATRYTMEQDFYTGYLSLKHGIKTEIPPEEDRNLIHDIIYNELCQGIIQESSKQQCLQMIERATKLGCDSVILGCTEIGLLINQQDLNIPIFDTTALHAGAAIDFALKQHT